MKSARNTGSEPFSDPVALCRALPLFSGMTENEIRIALRQMNGKCEEIPKGTPLLRQGEPAEFWGIVLHGVFSAQHVGPDGTLSVISTLSEGRIFGEILIFSGTPSPIFLIAQYDSTVLRLNAVDPAQTDPKLIGNLMKHIAEEYWDLHEKIRYASVVRLRDRITAYLTDRQTVPGEWFTVSFDRAGMAAYLNADRSALSRELSRMRSDGILEYRKNRFRIVGGM